jgi:hypothetical protein
MAMNTDELERRLLNDLQTLGDLVADESFHRELYRGLAGTRWFLDGENGAHVSFSWKRAEEAVNNLRAEHGREPLALAQTGGEGQVTGRVADALEPLGWHARAATAGHDDARVDAEPQRASGGGEPPEWRRQADAEAERNRG